MQKNRSSRMAGAAFLVMTTKATKSRHDCAELSMVTSPERIPVRRYKEAFSSNMFDRVDPCAEPDLNVGKERRRSRTIISTSVKSSLGMIYHEVRKGDIEVGEVSVTHLK